MKNKKKTVIILCILGIIIVTLGIFYKYTNKNNINFKDNTLVKVEADKADEGSAKIIENNIEMKMKAKVVKGEYSEIKHKTMKKLEGTLTIENKTYPFDLKETHIGDNVFLDSISNNSGVLRIHFNLNTKAILIYNSESNTLLFNHSDKLKSYDYTSILYNVNGPLKLK